MSVTPKMITNIPQGELISKIENLSASPNSFNEIAKALQEVATTNGTAPTAEQVGGSSRADEQPDEQPGEQPEEGLVAESISNSEDAAEAAAEPQRSDSELATGSASSNSDNKLLHSGTKLAPL